MNFFKKNTGLLLRFDDIAPNMNWKMMDKCEKLFLTYNIKPVLGVIPNNEDNELLTFPLKENFWEKVKQWQSFGWEICIHGYNHKYVSNTKKRDYFNYHSIISIDTTVNWFGNESIDTTISADPYLFYVNPTVGDYTPGNNFEVGGHSMDYFEKTPLLTSFKTYRAVYDRPSFFLAFDFSMRFLSIS